MNKISIILTLFVFMTFVFTACEPEVEDIVVTEEIPETVIVTNKTISGTVTNKDGTLEDNAKVDLIINGVITSTTNTINGAYSISVDTLSSNTLLKVHGNELTPAYYIFDTTDTQNEITQDFIVENFSDIQLGSQDPLEFDCGTELRVTLSSDIFTALPTSYTVSTQSYDMLFDDSNVNLPTQGIDENGNEISIRIRHAFYVSANGPNDEILDIKEGEDYLAAIISDAHQGTIWYFDESKAVWIEQASNEPVRTGNPGGPWYHLNTNKFGLFAVVTTCGDDIKAPTPYCYVGLERSMGTANSFIVEARFFDAGFFDDCDDDLTLHVKRETGDPCNYNDDDYKGEIKVCDSEIGDTIVVFVKATDDWGNSDYCRTSFMVVN